MESVGNAQLACGDSLEILPVQCDAVVCDPPYGLRFMGKKWDYDVPSVELWRKVLASLKPGGHLLAFGGTRTYHRLVVAIEDAGFEPKDCIVWSFGSGFPKSANVSKAIDKAAGAERPVVGYDATRARPNRKGCVLGETPYDRSDNGATQTAAATDAAKQWDGFGSALKPAVELVCLARKPLEGTIAANVLKHGTGGLNIDGCRIEPTGERLGGGSENRCTFTKKEGWDRPWMHDPEHAEAHAAKVASNVEKATQAGRWPANLVTDGSEQVVSMFPSGSSGGITHQPKRSGYSGFNAERDSGTHAHRDPDSGSAARFFKACPYETGELEDARRLVYCAKASKRERDAGLDDLPLVEKKTLNDYKNPSEGRTAPKCGSPTRNFHNTVKPIALMRYLCKLITPPGGVILDPFMGSGSTGVAALREGFQFIGIEREQAYYEIAKKRIEHEQSFSLKGE